MKQLKIVLTLAFIALQGCATATENKIESDISQQTESTSAQAVSSGRQAITDSTNLSVDQKQKMLTLLERTQTEMASIRKDEAQVKSSLLKYLAAGNFKDREIATYRGKLIKSEHKKMNLMFSNLRETRIILGKEFKLNPDLMILNHINAELL